MKTRNLKTKTLSILLAIVMLLGMLPVSVFAATTEDNIITLSQADLVERASGEGWSFEADNGDHGELYIENGYSLVFEGECISLVSNSGTIKSGNFSAYVTNAGTIEDGNFSDTVNNIVGVIAGGNFTDVNNNTDATITGGVFTKSVINSLHGTITGNVDLSALRSLVDHGGQYGQQVKLPKIEIKGNLTYINCGSSTPVKLEYHADGHKADEWTVSGDMYSFKVERYKRTDPNAELSRIQHISHIVLAAPMDGYNITIESLDWPQFNVTVKSNAHGLIITGGSEGTNYTYDNGVLDIKTAGTYEIKNADNVTVTGDIIKVSAPEGTVNITLGGVNIVTTEGMSAPAFEITGDCTTSITLADGTENILDSWESRNPDLNNFRTYAGLQSGEHPLTISCEHSEEAEHICDDNCGSLEAVGGNYAACIGGGYNMPGKNITIHGGNITADFADNQKGQAGIGGGSSGNGSNITISGGNIVASSVVAAAIGGGSGGNGSNITISGGIVTATGQDAGIGGDDSGSCSNVTISGGIVTATSTLGVGIGHGANGDTAENIIIAPVANMGIYAYNGSDNTGTALAGSPFTTKTDITNLLSGKAFYSVAEHVHSFSNDWTYDSANHWHVATCCDGVVSDKEAHRGGTATCTEKAICTTCGQPYGEVLGHDYGDWNSNNDGTHTRSCANDANHTETDNCSGGTATCTEKAKCDVCDTAYGNFAQHTYGTEWKSDGTNHWHECSCGAKADKAAHSGGTATCLNKAVCSACGTTYGALAAHSYKDGSCTVCKAAEPNYVPVTNNPQTGDSSNMALWIVLLFISGGAVAALTVIDRKRKTDKS